MRYTRADFYDPNLVFRPGSHEYLYCGWPMTSVTSIVHSFSKPFDALKNAQRVSEREQTPVTSILKRWQDAGELARHLGTAVHSAAERRSYGLPIRTPCNHSGYVRAVSRWFADNPEIDTSFAEPEVQVCMPEIGAAGMIDLVCGYNGLRSIIDFKTSKQINYRGYGNMYWPMNHLPDSNFWHYTIQLNLYAMILSRCYGIAAEFLGVVHVLSTGAYDVHMAPFLEEDVILKMVDKFHRKKGTEEWEREILHGLAW